jgi:probable HAF family extracellular repeat protein
MPVYTFTNFDDPLATDHFTNATGINASGNVVGFYEASGVVHGFLLSGGTYTTIDDPLGAKGTSAQSINDYGPDRRGLHRQRQPTPRLSPERRQLHDDR